MSLDCARVTLRSKKLLYKHPRPLYWSKAHPRKRKQKQKKINAACTLRLWDFWHVSLVPLSTSSFSEQCHWISVFCYRCQLTLVIITIWQLRLRPSATAIYLMKIGSEPVCSLTSEPCLTSVILKMCDAMMRHVSRHASICRLWWHKRLWLIPQDQSQMRGIRAKLSSTYPTFDVVHWSL